ncbi:MAG: aminotransferase class I/II-fold pyridoxal phosphate-dependent enzyme, partial [Duncaniella sp.]|nr:aminotransferase class I/II-fold pyridoxal phosphate-dependent enzyme [Duncaniella sp.]
MEENCCCPRYVDRHGSGCLKYDALKDFFGREELIPLWIADMDFAVAPEIVKALSRRLEHPVYGYSAVPDSYWDSIIGWLEHRHNWRVKREQLAHVGGIVRGIGLIINYFTSKGDKILIQPPVYHPFRRLIEENERVCVTNPLIVENGRLEMDLEDLEAKMEAVSYTRL